MKVRESEQTVFKEGLFRIRMNPQLRVTLDSSYLAQPIQVSLSIVSTHVQIYPSAVLYLHPMLADRSKSNDPPINNKIRF